MWSKVVSSMNSVDMSLLMPVWGGIEWVWYGVPFAIGLVLADSRFYVEYSFLDSAKEMYLEEVEKWVEGFDNGSLVDYSLYFMSVGLFMMWGVVSTFIPGGLPVFLYWSIISSISLMVWGGVFAAWLVTLSSCFLLINRTWYSDVSVVARPLVCISELLSFFARPITLALRMMCALSVGQMLTGFISEKVFLSSGTFFFFVWCFLLFIVWVVEMGTATFQLYIFTILNAY